MLSFTKSSPFYRQAYKEAFCGNRQTLQRKLRQPAVKDETISTRNDTGETNLQAVTVR